MIPWKKRIAPTDHRQQSLCVVMGNSTLRRIPFRRLGFSVLPKQDRKRCFLSDRHLDIVPFSVGICLSRPLVGLSRSRRVWHDKDGLAFFKEGLARGWFRGIVDVIVSSLEVAHINVVEFPLVHVIESFPLFWFYSPVVKLTRKNLKLTTNNFIRWFGEIRYKFG